jgi:hypothetical protein
MAASFIIKNQMLPDGSVEGLPASRSGHAKQDVLMAQNFGWTAWPVFNSLKYK